MDVIERCHQPRTELVVADQRSGWFDNCFVKGLRSRDERAADLRMDPEPTLQAAAADSDSNSPKADDSGSAMQRWSADDSIARENPFPSNHEGFSNHETPQLVERPPARVTAN